MALIRGDFIVARALPEEKALLEAIASQDRRNASEALRELVRAEGRRRGLWPPREQLSEQELDFA